MDIQSVTIIFFALSLPSVLHAAEKENIISASGATNAEVTAPFFTQPQITLSLKNYWKYLKEENKNPERVHNAWGQGVTLNYQSGFFGDVIGVDADYYGAVKLGASDYFNSRGVLYSQGNGSHKKNAHGYAKWGQRNLKVKYQLNQMQLNARWGWQAVKNFGVIISSTRLSPTTYFGWTGSAAYGGLTLRGAYFENAMARNSPDKKRFQTNTGKEINHIASGALAWEGDKLRMQYGYGESAHYLARHLLLTEYAPINPLSIGAQIYITQAQNDYRSMPDNKRDFDSYAAHYALDITWKNDRWRSKWGLGYTDARKENKVGFFPRHISKYSRGTFTSMTYAGDDYMRDREKVLSNLTAYDVAPNMAIGVTGNIAQFSYRHNHIRSGEVNLFTQWKPLKDLSIAAIAGPGWSYKSNDKTPRLINGRYRRTHTLASEIIIEYKFNLL